MTNIAHQDPSVLTVSFHHAAPGFYPQGSGKPQEVGEGSGLFHNLNLPLKAGCGDNTFTALFQEVPQRPPPPHSSVY